MFPGSGDLDYYMDNNTNDLSSFLYKYNPANPVEYPTYNNLLPSNFSTAAANTCPVMQTRGPQPPLPLSAYAVIGSDFKIQSTAIVPADDDGTAGRPASTQASVLTPEQQTNLDNMSAIQQELTANHDNWSAISTAQKQQVLDVAYNEPMYGGSVARMLLTHYEGMRFDPIVLYPKNKKTAPKLVQSEANNIYPNPTTGHVSVNWQGSNSATFILYNIKGENIYHKAIKAGATDLDLTRVSAGTYIATIQVNGKQVYQQKLVKE
jgi:hypothetical protein